MSRNIAAGRLLVVIRIRPIYAALASVRPVTIARAAADRRALSLFGKHLVHHAGSLWNARRRCRFKGLLRGWRLHYSGRLLNRHARRDGHYRLHIEGWAGPT